MKVVKMKNKIKKSDSRFIFMGLKKMNMSGTIKIEDNMNSARSTV